MGIVLALMYLPFYVVFSIIGVVAAVRVAKGKETSGYEIVGFVVTPVLSVLIISLVWYFWETSGDLEGVRKIQVTAIAGLIMPFIIGTVGSFSTGFCAGAYFSTFTIPWLQIFVLDLLT